MLSNLEVLTVLQEQPHYKWKPENVKTVEFQTLEYLKKSPAINQSTQQVDAFLTQLVNWDLTKAEKLQLLNLRPILPVEVHLIVEECEERFDEQQVEKLIDIIQKYLPIPEDEEEGGDDSTQRNQQI